MSKYDQAKIQWDATARKWHVIQGNSLVEVLFAADTREACEAWLKAARAAFNQ